MSKYETTYGIGDVVYRANAYGVEKDIITKIRIEGLKHKISYGFKEPGGYWSLFGSSETWYSSNQVFDTEEKADKKYELLKEKSKLEEVKERLDRIKELKEELKEAESELEDDN